MNCSTCAIEIDNCTSCSPGLFLVRTSVDNFRGICVAVCPENFLSTPDFVCQPCHESCATCSKAGSLANCTKCQPGLNLQKTIPGSQFGFCLQKCEVSYQIQDPINRTCEKCFLTCETCAKPILNDACTSCFLNDLGQKRKLLSVVHSDTESGFCMEGCLNASFAEEPLQPKCRLCHASCRTCKTPNSANSCLSCPSANSVI